MPLSNTVIVCLENHEDPSALDMMNAFLRLRPDYFPTLAFELPGDVTPELYLEEMEAYFFRMRPVAKIVQQRHMSPDFALWPVTELKQRLTELSKKYPGIEQYYRSLRRLSMQNKFCKSLKAFLKNHSIACIDRNLLFLHVAQEMRTVRHSDVMGERDQHFFDELECLRAQGNVLVSLGKAHRDGVEKLVCNAGLNNHYIFVNTLSEAYVIANPKSPMTFNNGLMILSSPEETTELAQTILQSGISADITSAYDTLRQGQTKIRNLASTISASPSSTPQHECSIDAYQVHLT